MFTYVTSTLITQVLCLVTQVQLLLMTYSELTPYTILANSYGISVYDTYQFHGLICIGCSNRSDSETIRSYFHLPLKRKEVLKIWVHTIGRKSVPINGSTRVCSDHFVNVTGRLLRPDQYPMVNLPVLHITTSQAKPRKLLAVRAVQPVDTSPNASDEEESSEEMSIMADAEIQVSDDSKNVLAELSKKISCLEEQLHASKFCLANICEDDNKVLFYTGSPNYATLKMCYDYLEPVVHKLIYWGSKKDAHSTSETHGKSRSLTPMEEFFMILVRLCLGLFERDLADCFSVSASTVSRICCTWITFYICV